MQNSPFAQLAPLLQRLLQQAFLLLGAFLFSSAQADESTHAQAKAKDKADSTALLASHNQAALDLYAQLSQRQAANKQKANNLFFSPWSAHSLMYLNYAGAGQETSAEFAQALHLQQSPAEIPAVYQQLAQALANPTPNPNDPAPALHMANALIHTSARQSVTPQFQKLARESFGAEIFAGEVNAINNWVSGKTQGKIPRIFNALPANSSLVLLNALYFQGDWESPFKQRNTRSRPFYLAAGQSKRVQMMFQTGQFKLHETEEFQLLQMPYENSSLSMCVLLPRPRVLSLAELEAKLSAEVIEEFQTQLQEREKELVEIHLPRLNLNTQYNLKEAYQNLGIKSAFIPDQANFTGMGDSELYLTHILQKAILKVNEEGTVAVAVTGGSLNPFGHPPEPPEKKIFRANHPFLFWIQEEETGALLFLGRFTQP